MRQQNRGVALKRSNCNLARGVESDIPKLVLNFLYLEVGQRGEMLGGLLQALIWPDLRIDWWLCIVFAFYFCFY
jgi:hypothetical protein